MSIVSEFKEFAMRGNVVDMAAGIVVGGAFGKITTSFVNDVLMPPVGMMLGGVFAYTHRFGLSDELYRFVVAHGIVELSVICLAGAAGLAIGRAIARPGPDGRMASARAATRDAGTRFRVPQLAQRSSRRSSLIAAPPAGQ